MEGKSFISRGREALIKAAALPIPTYAISYFKLPASFCFNIESMMAKFWWRQKGIENKIYWIGWDRMCVSKFKGGMGFKKLHLFNMALLAKKNLEFLAQ